MSQSDTATPGAPAATGPATGLGLDAGGTATRWALAAADGRLLADGEAAALSGLQLADAGGRAAATARLREIAAAAAAAAPAGTPPPRRVIAGLTGYEAAQAPALAALAAAALGVPAAAVWAMTDIELAYRAAFAPGEGVLLYAGTGSIAAHLDVAGTLHRAGGRGAVIDDAGGGHWIARRALRAVWRAEDAEPGAWRRSALARQVFAHLGGSDWASTRQWVYAGPGTQRGEMGRLALAVAAAAGEGDADALALLHAAGAELARLALALQRRVGTLPLALGGRVFDLHPAVIAGLRAALPAGSAWRRPALPPHHAAARLAAQETPA